MNEIRQCPKCELRFRDENEVRDHLVVDHHVDPEKLEKPPPHAPRRAGDRSGDAS